MISTQPMISLAHQDNVSVDKTEIDEILPLKTNMVTCVSSNFLNVSNGVRCQTMLCSLLNYFNTHGNFQLFIDVINGDCKTSLRVIEWFVTNYAEKYQVEYELLHPVTHKPYLFEVNHQYQLELDGYTKKSFDPFCRSQRIILMYKNNDKTTADYVETTIGQLHFFSFIFKYKILDYINEHIEHIKKDIKERNVPITLKKRNNHQQTIVDEHGKVVKPRKKRSKKSKNLQVKCKNTPVSFTFEI